MATTVHAGPSWANALQSASDTAGTYRKATQEKEAHRLSQRAGEQALSQEAEAFEMDKQAFAQNARRLQHLDEAEQLETQIRLEERERLKQESSVQQHILRGALRPEKAQELDPAQLEGATPQQTAQLQGVLAAGREIRQQTEAAFRLGKRVTLELGNVTVGTGDAPYMPGYAEGLAALQQQLAGWQPGAGDPMELATQYQELQRENNEFQIQYDAKQSALKDLDAQYGGGPEYAVARALIRDGKLDEAADEAYRTKNPEAWKKTREDAQNEVILDVQRELADQFLSLALNPANNYEPGTEEWDKARASFYGAAREVYGPDVVPLSEKEQQLEALQAYAAAGVPKEEAKAAIRAGLSVEEYQASQAPQRPLEFARPPGKNGKAGFTKPPPIVDQGP